LATRSEEQIRRLRWQCRRGMLELDHLLLRFLELGYADLDAGRREELATLLSQQDQDLSDWFMGRREPDDPRISDLVRHIVAVASEPDRHMPSYKTPEVKTT
jgi:antitoxin CptB